MWGQGQQPPVYRPPFTRPMYPNMHEQWYAHTTPGSGMGMSMLKKMGWKPGEGLGKNRGGNIEPLQVNYKKNKRGLACAEEFHPSKSGKNLQINSSQPLDGKHPVSYLIEYCTRKHYDPPMFTMLLEEGPPHKRNFLAKVHVNGVDYQPEAPSPTKKQAKTEAAILCLRGLGLLPPACDKSETSPAEELQASKPEKNEQTSSIQTIQGKHPVSFLCEYCAKKHFDPPMFTISIEGPPHDRNFITKVRVNGVDYQPEAPSPTKKQAKTEAAILCLRGLGLLPPACDKSDTKETTPN